MHKSIIILMAVLIATVAALHSRASNNQDIQSYIIQGRTVEQLEALAASTGLEITHRLPIFGANTWVPQQ